MITTERIKLRAWRAEDALPLAAIQADPIVMQFLGGAKVASETRGLIGRLQKMDQAGEPIFWAVERISDGALMGAAGLHWLGKEFTFGPTLEVGWRLGHTYWGRGYATEAARASLDHAFNRYKVSRVYAFTALQNKRSEAVMRRLGMTKVEGGEFPHPDLQATDPSSMHMLYVAQAESGR